MQIDPGPMPTFTASAPAATRSRSSVARRHVAGHDVDVPAPLDLADRFDHVGRMAVGAIDDEEIDVLADQAAGPLKIKHTDGRSRPAADLAGLWLLAGSAASCRCL